MTDKTALPHPKNRNGDLRKVGVEIEIGGLEEMDVAEAIAAELGGTIEASDGQDRIVTGTELGDIEIFLDVRFRKQAKEGSLGRKVLDLSRAVVPLELVTQPILPDEIARLDALAARICQLGAKGSGANPFLGYGVHFNPEVTGREIGDVLPVLTAFALTEDLIREENPIDLSRRALPFVNPYPRGLLNALARREIGDIPTLVTTYLEFTTSRNHGLDMLALFAELTPDLLRDKVEMAGISARPTYHFRLPDCRIDEPGWTLSQEWADWVRVERIADNADLLADLRSAWITYHDAMTTTRGDWIKRTRELVTEAGL